MTRTSLARYAPNHTAKTVARLGCHMAQMFTKSNMNAVSNNNLEYHIARPLFLLLHNLQICLGGPRLDLEEHASLGLAIETSPRNNCCSWLQSSNAEKEIQATYSYVCNYLSNRACEHQGSALQCLPVVVLHWSDTAIVVF